MDAVRLEPAATVVHASPVVAEAAVVVEAGAIFEVLIVKTLGIQVGLIFKTRLVGKRRYVVRCVSPMIASETTVLIVEAAEIVVGVVVARIVAAIAEAVMLSVLCAAARLVVVVVVDHFHGAITEASAETRTALISAMPETAKYGLNGFKGERTCGDSGSGLKGSPEEAGLPYGRIRHLLVGLKLRRPVLRRWGHVLRWHLLIAGGGSLLLKRGGGLIISLSEQTTEKAGSARGLRALLLLLQLADLGLCLVERDVLDQNRLGKHVKRVGISGKPLVQKRFGVGVFFLERGLVQAIDEGIQKLFFLGSHE